MEAKLGFLGEAVLEENLQPNSQPYSTTTNTHQAIGRVVGYVPSLLLWIDWFDRFSHQFCSNPIGFSSVQSIKAEKITPNPKQFNALRDTEWRYPIRHTY